MQLLKSDVVIATRVLQVANTAAYASNKPRIGTIEEAVRNVGLGTVRNIALSVGVFDAFPPNAKDGFNLVACWQHSLAVAAVLERLCAATGEQAPATAHLVGLCHDVGEIVLRQCLAEQYDELAGLEGTASGGMNGAPGGDRRVRHPLRGPRAADHGQARPAAGDRRADSRVCRASAAGRKPPQLQARPGAAVGRRVAHGLQLAYFPAPVQPVTIAEYRAATGATLAATIDGQMLRCEVLCNTSLLARLAPADERELAKPLFERTRAALVCAARGVLVV